MDVGGWLRSLGLERYEAAFRENEIDEALLPNLTADDLKDLGVGIVGHRRKLLDAMPRSVPIRRQKRHRLSSRPISPRKTRPSTASHGDVLRLGGLNGPLGADGP